MNELSTDLLLTTPSADITINKDTLEFIFIRDTMRADPWCDIYKKIINNLRLFILVAKQAP